MKILKWINAILCCVLFITASKGAVISGTIPHFANSVVTISQYTDYVNGCTKQVALAKADSIGHFIFQFSFPGIIKLKLAGKDLSAIFYCEPDNTYTVSEKGNLAISEDKKGMNTILKDLRKDMVSWFKLFVDDSGWFINRTPPFLVLETLDIVKKKYCTANKEIFSYLEYEFESDAMEFIGTSYFRYDSTKATEAFNSLADEFLVAKPVRYDNPFYVSFFKEYATWSNRFTSRYEHYTDEIKGASRFRRDSLSELNKVCITYKWYNQKRYKTSGTIEELNSEVLKAKEEMTIPVFKDYMQQTIAAYNKISTGSSFPILALPNEKKELYSITTIHTPYILIDFWATWCQPCKESMKHFQSLTEQYQNRLTIVSISVDEEEYAMINYLNKNRYTGKWITLFNGSHGRYLELLNVTGYPTYYLLNADRKIIATPDWEKLPEELAKMIN